MATTEIIFKDLLSRKRVGQAFEVFFCRFSVSGFCIYCFEKVESNWNIPGGSQSGYLLFVMPNEDGQRSLT